MATPDTIHVSVVSAEEEIFDGEAEFVALPGESGELGIYPKHTPLMTRIRPDEVTVLAETAIRGRDLDEAAANEARKQAEEALRNRGTKIDYAKAQSELAMAIAQLQAISRQRKQR
jgi:F-type H+-transporting ATPase subunit epsilon